MVLGYLPLDTMILRLIRLFPKVALKLQSIIGSTHSVTSIIRNSSQITELHAISPSIKPLILSIGDSVVSDFTKAFKEADADVVVFAAGAAGVGGADRTKAVDYEGAVKVFDAIEGLPEAGKGRPKLVIVSAIDIRNPDVIPKHYVSIFNTSLDFHFYKSGIPSLSSCAMPTWVSMLLVLFTFTHSDHTTGVCVPYYDIFSTLSRSWAILHFFHGVR